MRGFGLLRLTKIAASSVTNTVVAAVMAASMGLFAGSSVSAAPVISIGATAGNLNLSTGTNTGAGYAVGDFLFDPVNLASGSGNGNCGAAGGTCLRFNQNATTVMTTNPAGGAFNLEGLSFVLIGAPAELGVFNVALSGTSLIVSADNGSAGCEATFCVGHNQWYSVLFNGAANNVTEILFDTTGTGNLAIGGISATVIPLPAAAWLLLGGLGGLGLVSRRRRRAAA